MVTQERDTHIQRIVQSDAVMVCVRPISRDIGIVSPASLTNELNHIRRSEENLCAILITPPDKSMLLCFSNEQNKIALFDSHQHGSYGGLIAVAT